MSVRNGLFDYRGFFNRQRTVSLAEGSFLLTVSLIFQYYSSAYSESVLSSSAGDLFLDHLPIIDLNPIIVEGALIAAFLGIILIIARPPYLLFSIKALAIFIATRAFFISITHIGIYPGQIDPGPGFVDQLYTDLNLQTGFFFSAHTGLPFLMALIFWKERWYRYLFLTLSAVLAASVLLEHIHYSIDVFAAPFMASGIFRISEYVFKDDYKLIRETR